MRLFLRGILLVCCWLAMAFADAAQDWTRFRGPEGSGRIDGPMTPVEWSSSKNLVWRTPLPGKGSSSPIVRGNYIFLTAYTGYGLDIAEPGDPKDLVRHLLAFDRNTGKELWRASVASNGEEDPYRGFITQHGYASSTPATDGERVYVLLGKSGLYAFDLAGNELWNLDVGQKSDPAKWGDGTSPIVVGDQVVLDAGVLGNHLLGIDKSNGEQIWSIENADFTNCWATPTPIRVGNAELVLFNVPNQVVAVDPSTGKEVWSAASPLKDASCGSIVMDGSTAYLMGSREGHATAIDCSPNAEDKRVVWKTRLRSGIGTPVILGDSMYWAQGGIFCAANLASGEYVYKERLPRLGGPSGGFPNGNYSSPVAVGDHIIQFTRNGESYVIRPGAEFDLVAHNPPFEGDESAFSATPAISDGQLFVRSEEFLYCIGESSE